MGVDSMIGQSGYNCGLKVVCQGTGDISTRMVSQRRRQPDDLGCHHGVNIRS
jgi:hypothetical protein